MTTSDIWLGDVVRAFEALEVRTPEACAAVARLLGFDILRGASLSRPTEPVETTDSAAPRDISSVDAGVRPVVDSPESSAVREPKPSAAQSGEISNEAIQHLLPTPLG